MVKITLKKLRLNKEETQKETAKALGIRVETWANYEKGNTFPDVIMIKKIEEHFNTTYSEIDFLCNKNTVKL